MNAFVYQAALWCEPCGTKVAKRLVREGKAPANIEDERTYDSDKFPKGPYADGGGESDSPQHCDACGKFLENPLTSEGEAWLREAVAEKRNTAIVKKWKRFYDYLF